MSTNALRALALAANLVLLGVVVWTSYVTFRVTDLARWRASPPALQRFEPPPVQDDPLQREREVYNRIATVFERKSPPEPTPDEPPPVDTTPKPQPNNAGALLVVMATVAGDGSSLKSTVMLGLPNRQPGQEVEKPFCEGMALDCYDEFKQFQDVIVQSIGADAIVLADRAGKEVARISMKRGEAPR